MSIVPYNANNEILYHDPVHGIIVLHNNQQNSISLLSTKTPGFPGQNPGHGGSGNPDNSYGRSGGSTNGYRDSFQGFPSSNTCPNCGFQWAAGPHSYRSQRRRSGDSNTLARVPSVEPRDHSPALFYGGSPQEFIRHDYFKLLGQLPSANEQESKSRGHHSLPKDIFNQGYFKRFFKKIPPFTLGSGAHAEVYKVNHVLNDINLGTYAVKRISVGNKIELLESVLNEVLILYELSVKGANENNLIRYNHVWMELGDISDSSTYLLPNTGAEIKKENSRVPYVFILQQYCGGGHLEDTITSNYQLDSTLSWKEKVHRERLKRRNTRRGSTEEDSGKKWLTEIEIWKFFKDIANGVNYLHLHGILHRDLKPSNCLLEESYNKEWFPDTISETSFEAEIERLPKVLVSDFGEGKFMDKHTLPEMFQVEEERKGNTGTLEYTAPELWLFSNYDPALGLENKKYINEFTYESDIYSLGLILCYLSVGSLPFSHLITGETDPQVIRTKIIDWYFGLSKMNFHEWFSEALGNVRESGSSICDEDFENLIFLMIKGEDEVSQEYSPRNRASASDVLKDLERIKKERLFPREVQPGRSELSMDRNAESVRETKLILQEKGPVSATSDNHSIETFNDQDEIDLTAMDDIPEIPQSTASNSNRASVGVVTSLLFTIVGLELASVTYTSKLLIFTRLYSILCLVLELTVGSDAWGWLFVTGSLILTTILFGKQALFAPEDGSPLSGFTYYTSGYH